jgi:phosphatidylglycerol:prolipoprotein diacylglycerol transferase
MVFPLDGLALCRHPSQLYESLLEGLVLFLIIFIMNARGVRRGIPTWSFITFYGLFRFFLEFFRQPDPHLGFIVGPFSMGQLLTIPMILVGGAMIIYLLAGGENPPEVKEKGKKKKGGKAAK